MTVLMPLSCWNNCNPQPTNSALRIAELLSIAFNVHWPTPKAIRGGLLNRRHTENVFIQNAISKLKWGLQYLFLPVRDGKFSAVPFAQSPRSLEAGSARRLPMFRLLYQYQCWHASDKSTSFCLPLPHGFCPVTQASAAIPAEKRIQLVGLPPDTRKGPTPAY